MIEQPKKTDDGKYSFQKVAGSILACVTLITLGIGINKYFIEKRRDTEKSELEKQNTSLIDSVERLHARLRLDSSSRKNFIIQNTQHFSFNEGPEYMPTVAVANASISPCIQGPPDGCWKSQVSAKPGDTVGFQFFFANTGTDSVSNVAIKYNLEYKNFKKTIICSGEIVVGNITASVGIAHVFSKEPIKLVYHPEVTKLYPTGTSYFRILKEDTLLGKQYFNIGKIPAYENSFGYLILSFKVEKAN